MRQPPSVKSSLLKWMVPAMLVWLMAATLITYFLASRAANEAYDRSLRDTIVDVMRGVQLEASNVRFSLPPEAEDILRVDGEDQIFFAVRKTSGELIGGDPDLSAETTHGSIESRFFRKHLVRIISANTEISGHGLIITVAGTVHKRASMFWAVIGGMVVPQLLLLGLGSVSLWFALSRGLQPLQALRRELTERNSSDLRPVDISHAPEEVSQFVVSLNGLFDRLKEVDQARQRFIADAAHQLRTPLAGIQGQVDRLIRLPPAEVSPALESLRLAVSRSIRLANQLLSMARVSPVAGPIQVLQSVNVPDLIATCADDWVHRALDVGIDLGFDLKPLMLQADAFLLREMLGNLIDNALKYTPKGGSVTFTCGCDDHGGWVLVEDSGPGIDEGDIERIFDPFVRGTQVLGGNASEGSGLGLTIVRDIAKVHGATVSVDHSPLGGARFRIDFLDQGCSS